MILITGAGGKSGIEVIKALNQGGNATRALVRRDELAGLAVDAGASEIVIGDMQDRAFMFAVLEGVDKVYHIPPNVSPEELSMAELVIEAARHHHVSLFSYHSVLHPQVEAMPHHWLKMRVEEMIFKSGLPFSIVQPAPYMQNILASWDNVTSRGTYSVPYDIGSRISMVDLQDVAQAVAVVLASEGHEGAIYELCGPDLLTQGEIAAILEDKLGIEVRAQESDRLDWEQGAASRGLGRYQIEALLKMFEYYERFGLIGNSMALSWLLGRSGTTFSSFVDRIIDNQL